MIIVGLAVLVFLLRGIHNGVSVLLGGLANWLPTYAFVWRIFSRASMRAAKQFVIAFFAGEAVKLLVSAILFLLIVKYLPVNTIYVLIGFVGAIIAFWVASFTFLSRNQGVSQ
jgi:ATP synthase protein I